MWLYLAILLLVLLVFLRKFEQFEEKKKGILVLYGESFRTGNMGTRERDCAECVETQKLASQSHNDFIQFVQQKYNITMDVLIDTYDTKYQKELKTYYKDPQYYSHPELLGWDKIGQDAVDRIDKTKYEFILLARIDILIKPGLYPVFYPHWKKIYFLSPIEQESFSCGFSKDEKGVYYPQVNPTFMFIPFNYFYTLQKLNLGHHAWRHYMETYQLTEKDMAFMVDYQFDTNSANLQNPYYKMVGRSESTVLMNKSHTIQYPLIRQITPTC